MAKIYYTSTIDHISGRLDNLVFSGNASGNYLKVFKNPAYRDNLLTRNARNAFGAVATQWKDVSVSDRDLWKTFANNGYLPLEPKPGTILYTGRQAFSSLNSVCNWITKFNHLYSIETNSVVAGGVQCTENYLNVIAPSVPPDALLSPTTVTLLGDAFEITDIDLYQDPDTIRTILMTLDHNISNATYSNEPFLIGGQAAGLVLYLSNDLN